MRPLFTEEKWINVCESWDKFWCGELERPLVTMEFVDSSQSSTREFSEFIALYPETLSVDEIVEIEKDHISKMHFVGDAFPKRFLNFGPGSIAGYLGSKVDLKSNTVWFKPLGKELKDLELRIDRECWWYRRIKELREALISSFGSDVVISFTDLGGNLDILASLRGTERLLYDLYDHPDEVQRKSERITELWVECFLEEASILREQNRGFTPWAPIFSSCKTNYMLQCDFSYMISPVMFERLVVPDIESCCQVIDIPFYHVDGKGQLPHLDLLLSIEKLRGIQWVPGSGQPEANQWPEILQRIRAADKFVQITVSVEGAIDLKEKMNLKGFVVNVEMPEGATTEEAQALWRELTS